MIACINVKSILETAWLTFVLKVFGRRELGDHEGVGQDLARGACYLRPRNSDDRMYKC